MMKHRWENHLTGAESQAILDELREVNSMSKQKPRKWLKRLQVVLEEELKLAITTVK